MMLTHVYQSLTHSCQLSSTYVSSLSARDHSRSKRFPVSDRVYRAIVCSRFFHSPYHIFSLLVPLAGSSLHDSTSVSSSIIPIAINVLALIHHFISNECQKPDVLDPIHSRSLLRRHSSPLADYATMMQVIMVVCHLGKFKILLARSLVILLILASSLWHRSVPTCTVRRSKLTSVLPLLRDSSVGFRSEDVH